MQYSSPILRCKFLARKSAKLSADFSATKVTSLPSLSLSLSLSLPLSPSAPHAQYRKRFRASYNMLGLISRLNSLENVLPICVTNHAQAPCLSNIYHFRQQTKGLLCLMSTLKLYWYRVPCLNKGEFCSFFFFFLPTSCIFSFRSFWLCYTCFAFPAETLLCWKSRCSWRIVSFNFWRKTLHWPPL